MCTVFLVHRQGATRVSRATFFSAGGPDAQLHQPALPGVPEPAARQHAQLLSCAPAVEPVWQLAYAAVLVRGASPPPTEPESMYIMSAHCLTVPWASKFVKCSYDQPWWLAGTNTSSCPSSLRTLHIPSVVMAVTNTAAGGVPMCINLN